MSIITHDGDWIAYHPIENLLESVTNLMHSDFDKEDGRKLLDFRGRFDSGYGEPSTSGIPGMKRRS